MCVWLKPIFFFYIYKGKGWIRCPLRCFSLCCAVLCRTSRTAECAAALLNAESNLSERYWIGTTPGTHAPSSVLCIFSFFIWPIWVDFFHFWSNFAPLLNSASRKWRCDGAAVARILNSATSAAAEELVISKWLESKPLHSPRTPFTAAVGKNC